MIPLSSLQCFLNILEMKVRTFVNHVERLLTGVKVICFLSHLNLVMHIFKFAYEHNYGSMYSKTSFRVMF